MSVLHGRRHYHIKDEIEATPISGASPENLLEVGTVVDFTNVFNEFCNFVAPPSHVAGR